MRRAPDHYMRFFATPETPKIDVHGCIPSGCLDTPETAANGLRIASLTDLLRQKLIAMCHRNEPRDGWDVAALLEDGRASVEHAVAGLHDDVHALGVGEEEAHALGERLADLPASPWHEYPAITGTVEALMATGLAPPTPHAEEIQGGPRVPQLARARRDDDGGAA